MNAFLSLYKTIRPCIFIYLLGLAVYSTIVIGLGHTARLLVGLSDDHSPLGTTIGSVTVLLFIHGFDTFLPAWSVIMVSYTIARILYRHC